MACKAERQPDAAGTCPASTLPYAIPQADGSSVPCCTQMKKSEQTVEGFAKMVQHTCRKLQKIRAKCEKIEAALMLHTQMDDQGNVYTRPIDPKVQLKLARLRAKHDAVASWLRQTMSRGADDPQNERDMKEYTRLHMDKIRTTADKARAEQKKQVIEDVVKKDQPTGGGVLTLLHTLKSDGDTQAYDDVVQVLRGGGKNVDWMQMLQANKNTAVVAATALGAAYMFKDKIANAIAAVWKGVTDTIQYCAQKLEKLGTQIANYKISFMGRNIPGLLILAALGGLWHVGILQDMCHANQAHSWKNITKDVSAGTAAGTTAGAGLGWFGAIPGAVAGAAVGAKVGFVSGLVGNLFREPDYGWVCGSFYTYWQTNFGTSVSTTAALGFAGLAAFTTMMTTQNPALALAAGTQAGAKNYAEQKGHKVQRAMTNLAGLAQGRAPTAQDTVANYAEDTQRSLQTLQQLGDQSVDAYNKYRALPAQQPPPPPPRVTRSRGTAPGAGLGEGSNPSEHDMRRRMVPRQATRRG